MNITGISYEDYGINTLTPSTKSTSTSDASTSTTGTTFDSLLQSAMGMIDETNQLSNAAEEEEIKYAMGMSDSIHDLQVAQQKANVSLQYTVAVKNTAIEAYKSLINMQF